MRRVGLIAAVILAVFPATAIGRPFGPVEEAAYQDAASYWGHTPELCTSVAKEVVAPGTLGPGVSGRATQPEGLPVPCGLWVVEGLGEFLCSTMRHEYGHLLGYGHEDAELQAVGPCDQQPALVVARRQAWAEWRESRAECREARGPYRKKCWRELRAQRKHLTRQQVALSHLDFGRVFVGHRRVGLCFDVISASANDNAVDSFVRPGRLELEVAATRKIGRPPVFA